MQQPSETLLQAIAVTAELTGTELSKAAANVMAEDLAQYPENKILAALVKCRRELKGRMTPNDVISRIEDGRPGPEEAWAMIPTDEAATLVWTDEMRDAWAVALPLIESGDLVQARMAFTEVYRKRCQAARDAHVPVKWTVSLGHDAGGRESVLLDAVAKGRIQHSHALSLLPHNADVGQFDRLLSEANARLLGNAA